MLDLRQNARFSNLICENKKPKPKGKGLSVIIIVEVGKESGFNKI
jgi:hypothetical protein